MSRCFQTGLLVLALLAGCGKGEEKHADYLRLRLAEDPTTLDPAFIVDVPGGSLAAKIFNGLTRFDPEGKVVPDLASSWEVSPDGKTCRFHLRDGLRFHSGRPVTAADVVYSWKRLLDPALASPRSWLLQGVKGAEDFRKGAASDVAGLRAEGTDVIVELDEPSPIFLSLLAMPNAYVVDREAAEKPGRSFADHPSGTGPFRLTEWRRGERIVLSANADYYRGKPSVAGVLYRVIPEELTTTVEFESGNLDLIEVPRAEFRKYSTDERWKGRVRERVGLNVYYLGFNCQSAPYDDPRFRRALSLALDREKIIEAILEGRAVAAGGPVPPGLLPVEDPPPARYDPEEAKRLLQECGIALPFTVRLTLKADREVLSIAEVIQDYFRKIGLDLVLVQREWSAFKEAVNGGDFDLFYLSWWGDYPEAENFLYPTFHSSQWGAGGNRARFRDPKTDGLLEQARRETDPERSRALFVEARDRIVELAPWAFLWHKKEYVILSPRVRDYRIPLVYNSERFEEIELVNGE